MSRANLEQFMNQVADSEELQAKIGDEIEADSLIALGAEHGCEFTAEELQEAAELTDEELDEVAGGGSTFNRTGRLSVIDPQFTPTRYRMARAGTRAGGSPRSVRYSGTLVVGCDIRY
ncbi:MAG TPA: hypothetical protein DG414_07385 [Gammaproteobacteria bacterium]|jgi:predicted ribosomally synthesized peptide with nif11-like leader|nr:hypothetical protein [Gammaproteobacteria bacterium]|tara:strand:+ start:2755 stop:3108 length:354 start_codon:yes stop_codon:yes gene_type:complete